MLRADYHLINRRINQGNDIAIESISSYTRPTELVALYELANKVPHGATCLEIGSHLGKSANYICSAIAKNDGILYCVDTWNNETMPEGELDTFDKFEKNTLKFRANLIPIRKNSRLLGGGDMPKSIDLAFIDGDHSYAGAKNDFSAIQSYIPSGGIVVFHDAVSPHFPGVGMVVGEALATGEWVIGGQTDTMFWIQRE